MWNVRKGFRGGLISLLSSFGVVPASLAGATAAHAESCGTDQNLQVGTQSASLAWQIEGVSAQLQDAGGYVLCTTDTNGGSNFSTAWKMIFGNGEAGGWAQSGTMYRYGSGTCVRKWAEQRRPGYTWLDYYVPGECSDVGEINRYWQQSANINGSWVMRSNVDTTVIHQTTWSPYEMPTPRHAAYSSETYYAQSHVPGTPAVKEKFHNMQVQKYNDHLFYSTCGNVTLALQ